MQPLRGLHNGHMIRRRDAGVSIRHSSDIRLDLQQPERHVLCGLLRRDLETLFCWTAMSQPQIRFWRQWRGVIGVAAVIFFERRLLTTP